MKKGLRLLVNSSSSNPSLNASVDEGSGAQVLCGVAEGTRILSSGKAAGSERTLLSTMTRMEGVVRWELASSM